MSFKPRYILAEEAEERIVALYRKERGDAAEIFNTAIDACQSIILDMYDNAPAEVEPVKHGRWIPVSERLPKQGQEVICQCRARIIKVLKLDADGDWYQDASHCYMRGFVIAWMPLPEPYKEGEAHETD